MKTTLATVKSFIRKNPDTLLINVKSAFDGMTDCCQPEHAGFTKAQPETQNQRNTLGVCGAWFVGGSRDYFTPYNVNGLTGFEVSNCCGHFILAVPQN